MTRDVRETSLREGQNNGLEKSESPREPLRNAGRTKGGRAVPAHAGAVQLARCKARGWVADRNQGCHVRTRRRPDGELQNLRQVPPEVTASKRVVRIRSLQAARTWDSSYRNGDASLVATSTAGVARRGEPPRRAASEDRY